jgi:hypothetical protein
LYALSIAAASVRSPACLSRETMNWATGCSPPLGPGSVSSSSNNWTLWLIDPRWDAWRDGAFIWQVPEIITKGFRSRQTPPNPRSDLAGAPWRLRQSLRPS